MYLFTAPPSMLWLDAARFVAAMTTLGVSNPPEPLYVLMGHLFTYLPFGSMIFRIQIFSAILAFGTLVAVYFLTVKTLLKIADKTTLKLKKNQHVVITSGLFAILTLGFSYQFWSQSQNIETFILVALMVVITNILLLEISNRKNFFTHLAFLSVFLGLGSGTNPVLGSVIPSILFILWKFRKFLDAKRFFILAALGAGAFIVIHLYIPWAASRDPFLNWGRATTLEGIIEVSTGAGLNVYVPELGRINGLTGSPAVFLSSMWRYIQMLWLNFTPIMLPFIFIGGLYLYLKNRYIFTILILNVLMNIFLSGLYLSGNQESWFLMSYVIYATFAGFSFYALMLDRALLVDFVLQQSKIVDQLHDWVMVAKKNLENLNLKKSQTKYLPWALFSVVFIQAWFWWPILDRREWYLLEDYVSNLYKPLQSPAILFGSADLFDSMSYYVYDVVGTCKSGVKNYDLRLTINESEKKQNNAEIINPQSLILNPDSKQIATSPATSSNGKKCLGADVVPVTDNILYMLQWYRENLKASVGLNMPDDTNLTYDNRAEYSKFINDFIAMNIDKNHVYIDQPALRNNFMSPGDKLPSLQIDPAKFKLVPYGMVYEVVKVSSESAAISPQSSENAGSLTADSEADLTTDSSTIDPSAFEFKFKTKGFPRKQPVMLEKVYNGELIGMINEYALSLESLGDYYMQANTPAKALEFYQQAYAFNPKNAEIISRLGNFYGATGDPQKAASFFKKAIVAEPENVGYKFNLAIAYLNLGQTSQSKKELNEIIKTGGATSPIVQQAKAYLSQLESVESGKLNLPEGWKEYKNEDLNISFAHPDGYEITEGKDQITLTNNLEGKDNLTLIFTTQQVKAGEDLVKLEEKSPFTMDGLLVNTQPVNLLGFQSQIKMYANGPDLSFLLLLLRDNQGVVAKVSPGDSTKSEEFGGILQSIRLIK